MSREIKFRAWDNYSKSFVEDDEYLIGLNGKFYRMDFYSGIENYEDGNLIFNELDNITLSQFTGLLDKNGKEIFEGDIVVLLHPCWSVKCIVKYDNQLACFVLESFEKIDKGVRKSFLHIYQEDLNYKVIGNIYQNPELLGGEND